MQQNNIKIRILYTLLLHLPNENDDRDGNSKKEWHGSVYCSYDPEKEFVKYEVRAVDKKSQVVRLHDIAR